MATMPSINPAELYASSFNKNKGCYTVSLPNGTVKSISNGRVMCDAYNPDTKKDYPCDAPCRTYIFTGAYKRVKGKTIPIKRPATRREMFAERRENKRRASSAV